MKYLLLILVLIFTSCSTENVEWEYDYKEYSLQESTFFIKKHSSLNGLLRWEMVTSYKTNNKIVFVYKRRRESNFRSSALKVY